MPNYTIQAPHRAASDANFRAIGSAFSAALAGVGLVKVPDTGTINWSTVTCPSSGWSFSGSEMWRFNDAAQSTTPIFIKVLYGRASDGFFVRMFVGSATDGALTLSGLGSTTALDMNYGGTSYYDDVNPRITLISSDGSGLYVGMMIDGATGSYWRGGRIVIDRFRNSDGSPTTTGFMSFQQQNQSQVNSYMYDRVNNLSYTGGPASLLPAVLPYGFSQRQRSGAVPLGLYYAMVPNLGIYRSKMLISVPGADIGAFSEFQANVLGSSRTYKAHGMYDAYWDTLGQLGASSAQWWSD